MYTAVIVLLVVAALAAFISSRPAEFNVTRSAVIAAPPAKVFANVNELQKWEAWSPWAKLDPGCKTTFEGPAAGTGAVMRWDGNSKVGTGSMTITESRPAESVQFRLDFLKPFKATNTATFTFRPEGGNTAVTWTMNGQNNFISKAMSCVMDCEKMVGPQFEKGLSQLKAVAEGK
jgi:uncharacterized protein YndB with AHSA1/START domain